MPSKFRTDCTPTVLPAGALNQAQVEQLWARDRVKLVRCGYSLNGLLDFYEDLGRRLSASAHPERE